MSRGKETSSSSLIEDQKRFLAYAAPTCMLIVSPFGLSFFTIMFAGWRTKELLSGVALANTTYNIFMMSFMCGFCSLLSTYGPQVYGVMATKRHLGTVLQKVFLISFTVYLMVLGPYMRSLSVISWLIEIVTDQLRHYKMLSADHHHDNATNFAAVQAKAEEFIRGTWSWAMLDFTMRLTTKYLSLQYHSIAVYSSTGLLLLLHITLTHYFTIHLEMDLEGLVLGGTLSRLISLLVLLLYCFYKRDDLAWAGFTTKILDNWREMMVLGFSASVNVFSEMGMYELAIFLSQFRGLDYLATVVISFQLITLIYSTTYGVCYAGAAMIGSALGEGDEEKIRRYMKLCLGNTLLESVILALLGYLYRYELVGLFTEDPSIIQETGDMLWILLIEVPLDHIQTLFSYGILVTVGCQVFVATALAAICYGICTPIIAANIFFTNLNGIGVLLGMLLFVTLSCIVCGCKVLSLDIGREINRVKNRIQDSISPARDEEGISLTSSCCDGIDDTDESLLEVGTYKSVREFRDADVKIAVSDLKNNTGKVVVICTLVSVWIIIGILSVILK